MGGADSPGTHRLRVDVAGAPVHPLVVQAEATVLDLTRQTMSSTSHVLVHPADVYVGLRSPRLFVHAGEPIDVEAIVTDLDGRLVGGRPV